MILINLLPHREAARKKRKERFFAMLGLSAVLGGLIGVMGYSVIQQRLDAQEDRNAILVAEISKLDQQIKEIVNLQGALDALKARQRAVEGLQVDRNTPVHLMQEMGRLLPEGIVLKSIKQEALSVQLLGVAQSQEQVSELLRNLNTQSKTVHQPELLEIVASTQGATARDQRRLFNFSVKVQLQRMPKASDAKAQSN